jgi:hypothetical protein
MVGWDNSGYTIDGTNTSFAAGFEEVTNSVPTAAPQSFSRLTIEYN